MPRTRPRSCPAGRHQLTPDTRSCLSCEAEATLTRIKAIVVSIEPTLDPGVVTDAISGAARSVDQLRRLLAHLESHPVALTAGASNVPNVLTRLAHELVRRGAQQVVLPRCHDCGQAKPLLSVVPEGRICENCRSIRRAEPCSHCTKTLPVCGRGPGGAAVCSYCWRQDPAHASVCTICGKAGPVSTRDPEGRPTCGRCYQRPLLECGQCGNIGRIVSRRSGTPLCVNCYESPVQPCGRCGHIRPIARRARAGDPDLCDSCARPPFAGCMRCGTRGRCHFVSEGRPVCVACSPVRTVPCSHCGDVRTVTAQWPEGPVCQRCYAVALRRRGECTSCGQQRRLVDPPGPGAERCATCAGLPIAHVCGRCGMEDKLYEVGLCPRCVLKGPSHHPPRG